MSEKEKSAKEMFEELGYTYSKVSGNIYIEEKWLNGFEVLCSKNIVVFETRKKWFSCYKTFVLNGEISLKLFKAIQKQIEELRWEK